MQKKHSDRCFCHGLLLNIHLGFRIRRQSNCLPCLLTAGHERLPPTAGETESDEHLRTTPSFAGIYISELDEGRKVHIKALQILNFRGIREVQLRNLGNMIIIAGQNGSGKSCIFDGIRLLKSVYGGYQQNEWQQWMGEFQINLAVPSSFKPIFNDENKNVLVRADFSFSDEETTFLRVNANELLRETFWRDTYS